MDSGSWKAKEHKMSRPVGALTGQVALTTEDGDHILRVLDIQPYTGKRLVLELDGHYLLSQENTRVVGEIVKDRNVSADTASEAGDRGLRRDFRLGDYCRKVPKQGVLRWIYHPEGDGGHKIYVSDWDGLDLLLRLDDGRIVMTDTPEVEVIGEVEAIFLPDRD